MQAHQIIDEILTHEGGYVDHPNDRLGCTNFGIPKETLSKWRNEEVNCEDVKELTEEEAREIYLSMYIEDPKFDELEEPLKSLMVDSGVQHGPSKAIEWLQESIGTTVDGIIGPETLRAINEKKIYDVYYDVLAKRTIYYGAIISNDESQAVFAEGWMGRVSKFIMPIHKYLLE